MIRHDLAKGIPLDDDSCDLVYSSAVLEHIRRDAAVEFVRECHRVLRPGGIIRVGVPDLEGIAAAYLEKLRVAVDGSAAAAAAEADYDWMMLEFYDQAVRERSGGTMLEFLRTDPPNRDFILERIGMEGEALFRIVREEKEATTARARKRSAFGSARRLGKAVRNRARRLLMGGVLTAEERRMLEIGRFRMSGEVHQWMYDRFSLDRLLRSVGFSRVTRQGAGVSSLSDFGSYELEVTASGAVVKPDLLYMEGQKGFSGG